MIKFYHNSFLRRGVLASLFIAYSGIVSNLQAQELLLMKSEEALVYDFDLQKEVTQGANSSLRESIPEESQPLDKVFYKAEVLSSARIPSEGYDFFQGIQNPHATSKYIYMEREQVGAGFRIWEFDATTREQNLLLEKSNDLWSELAFKPIAFTKNSDEVYLEALYLDAAEEHEGVWLLNTTSKKMQKLAVPHGYVRTPLLSPDRKQFVFTGSLDKTIDYLHGTPDVINSFDIRSGEYKTLLATKGVPLKVVGWKDQLAICWR